MESRMSRARAERVAYEVVELDGVRYAILRESVLQRLWQRGGAECTKPAPQTARLPGELPEADLDGARLAARLLTRRKRAGLSQAELARRARRRVETEFSLDRIARRQQELYATLDRRRAHRRNDDGSDAEHAGKE